MENATKKTIGIIAISLTIVAGLIIWLQWIERAPSKYDVFAKCLKDEGLKFYGAFWCSHCQNQKRMFGGAAKHLPYIECSTPDSNGQLPVCSDANISVYPTWEFPDGSRQQGELSLQILAEKSGCELVQ